MCIIRHFLIGVAAVTLFGCGMSEDERLARTPKNLSEAASELELVFADADSATKENAAIATQALRERNYDKAVVSIMYIRNQDNLTFEQGMILRNSMVTLQQDLIRAAEDGDPKAIKANVLLRQMK
jgi:U3 small nucleolar RNA-associated protein 14